MLTYKVSGSFNCITTNTISNLSKNSKFFNNKNEKNALICIDSGNEGDYPKKMNGSIGSKL